MSNTKRVEISGQLPFYWLADLDDKEAAFVARLFLNPVAVTMSNRMRIRYWNERFVSNEYGGKTATYDFQIVGTEAFHIETLMRIVLKAGVVYDAEYTDLDDDNTRYQFKGGQWVARRRIAQ